MLMAINKVSLIFMDTRLHPIHHTCTGRMLNGEENIASESYI